MCNPLLRVIELNLLVVIPIFMSIYTHIKNVNLLFVLDSFFDIYFFIKKCTSRN